MGTTTQALQVCMDHYLGGSEGRTRHIFNQRLIYTDGVKAVADLAGAYWLLDIVATEVAPIALTRWELHRDGQTFLNLLVKDSQVRITLEDGNGGAPYFERSLQYTDFPTGTWTFYLFMDGCLDPKQELLVMLLPQEN